MAAQYSITVPDPLQEMVDLISEEKQISKSATVVYLMEKGLPLVVDELSKSETYKELVERRKTKKNTNTVKATEVEANGKSTPKEVRGSSDPKSKK